MARSTHKVTSLRDEIRKRDPDYDRDLNYSLEYDFEQSRGVGRKFYGKVAVRGPYTPTEEE